MRKQKQSLEKSMAVIKGREPYVTADLYKEQLTRALNWYNTNWEEKQYRQAAIHYVVNYLKMKNAAYAVSKASFLEIRSIGVIGRLVEREQHIELDTLQKVLSSLEELQQKYVKPRHIAAAVSNNTVATVSVQDRIAENAHALAGDVEGALDDYLVSGEEFSMKAFIATNHVSGVVARKVASLFEPRLKELDEAVKGKDAQLKEGYSQYTKRGLKQMIEFIRQIIADCDQHVVSAKSQRKPRAKKVKPPAMLVKQISFVKEFEELKLKSVPAEKLIDASEAWIYNTATRKLTVFYGADGGFLSVRGKSIINYDIAKSGTKTLRKPEVFFKSLTTTGKRAMANAWKSIKGKLSKPRGRISKDLILFAVN